MLHIRINHICENGKIDFAYLYDDDIEAVLHDIDMIEGKGNYRVSIYDDEECTQYEATYYSLNVFKYIYGGGKWEEEQEDQESDQASMNFTAYMTTKANQSKISLPFGE